MKYFRYYQHFSFTQHTLIRVNVQRRRIKAMTFTPRSASYLVPCAIFSSMICWESVELSHSLDVQPTAPASQGVEARDRHGERQMFFTSNPITFYRCVPNKQFLRVALPAGFPQLPTAAGFPTGGHVFPTGFSHHGVGLAWNVVWKKGSLWTDLLMLMDREEARLKWIDVKDTMKLLLLSTLGYEAVHWKKKKTVFHYIFLFLGLFD